MQEMETVLRHPLFQFVFSGCLVLLQLYIVSIIKPIKKSIDRIEKTDEKQWETIEKVQKQLDTLQGEHNVEACKR